MPVPTKKQGENEEQFINRCMSELSGEYEDTAQRYAVCIGSFEGVEDMSLFKYQYQKKNDINKLRTIGREIAIKSNMFKFESYNDYPESVSNNACKVLRWRDEHGDEVKGMTIVGWTRANQLCGKENISRDTIARMAAFERHRKNAEVAPEFKDTPWKDAGYVAWLGWGGTTGIEWAKRKLDIIDRKKFNDLNMDVYGYKTKYFYICPGAVSTFEHLVLMDNDEDTKGMIRSAAVVADSIFKIEDDVLKSKVATQEQLNEAIVLVDDFKDIINEIDKISGMVHNVDYMDNHIDVIKSYVKEMMAEIGPRGGINPTKKAPKSDTPNTDPKRGSDKNEPGAASKGRGVEVPASVERSLQKKADEWNEKFKEKRGYGASVGMLKTVYQRGVGAFQTSHSPLVRSSEQWAQARVNAFLYLLKNGRPENPKYVNDNDLLPKGHPKSDK